MSADGRSPGLFPSFRSILALAVVALLLLLAVGGLKGYRELSEARQREAELQTRLLETRAGVERLARRIERLRDDPELLERLARDELMMIRPGELVVVYPREAPAAAVEAPSAGETADPTAARAPGGTAASDASSPPAAP